MKKLIVTMLAGVMALGLVACGGSSDSAAESKVPAKAVTETSMNITITASATGTTYKAYRYEPTNKDMQPITPATPEKETTDVTSKLTLNILLIKINFSVSG